MLMGAGVGVGEGTWRAHDEQPRRLKGQWVSEGSPVQF